MAHTFEVTLVSGLFLYVCLAQVVVQAGVPMDRNQSTVKPQWVELGLYNSSDKVVVLTSETFESSVLQQEYASLVEFYNSYCGHCRRFAPTYKKLAEELFPWRDVLKVCAIDCAADENNGICREYEVMKYPTLRYFGLHHTPSTNDFGKPLETQDIDAIRETLANWIVSENSTSGILHWPDFRALSEEETDDLFANLDSKKLYLVLVYEPANETVGIETILHFQRHPVISVRRISNADVAARFHIDGGEHRIAVIDRTLSSMQYSSGNTSKSYIDSIRSALEALHVTEEPIITEYENKTKHPPNTRYLIQNEAILKEVHSNKHLVYQADLEMAVHYTLYNEVPKVSDISGDRLLALQRYLSVLKRYNPLGSSGQFFISSLSEFVVQHNQNLNGKRIQEEVKRLEQLNQPIFSAKNFVGCVASKQGLRGFTCSLWLLFHYLTVQAANSELSQDPLEVLQAMHGYIKFFFGCSDCSEHFQEMAFQRKMWNTSTKDEAVLWLWAAHNTVNQRLAGDTTEDPEFPKIQFPSKSSCSECHKEFNSTSESVNGSWKEDAVLRFLKNIHNPKYISRFGLENEKLSQLTLDRLRQKRMIGNVFFRCRYENGNNALCFLYTNDGRGI